MKWLTTFCVLSSVAAIFSLGVDTIWAQDMAVIGVGDIQSSIRGADPISFQTMIETQLVKTNKFRIIERSRLAEILKEKGLGQVGVTTGGNNSISGVQGIDYLVFGSI